MKSHVLTPTLLGERKHAEGSDGVEDCAHAALVDNVTCRVDVIHRSVTRVGTPRVVGVGCSSSTSFGADSLIIGPGVSVTLTKRVVLDISLPSHTLILDPVLVAS